MEDQVREIILQLGEDPGRQGLRRTPQRTAESLKFLTSGYGERLEELVNGAIFEDRDD